MRRVGVVLMNLGGPNNADAVQPFLNNLFMDEDILRIPRLGGLKKPLIGFLTERRARKVVEKYKEINACPEGCLGPKTCSNRLANRVSSCCSATNPITEWQRRALEKKLNALDDGCEYQVVTAMRYWYPSTDDAIDRLIAESCEALVLLPLYPQFSYSTTGSSLNEWNRRLVARQLTDRWTVATIKDYATDPHYIASVNQRIDEALAPLSPNERAETHLLFSAHGTPLYFQEEGDPYSEQVAASVEAVMNARGHDLTHWQSYQSRVGPIKWLKPNSEDFIKTLYGYGIRRLLVVPIAFVGDHIETVHEIGIEFREVADELGYTWFEHTQGLNDMPSFVEGLAAMVQARVDQLRESDEPVAQD